MEQQQHSRRLSTTMNDMEKSKDPTTSFSSSMSATYSPTPSLSDIRMVERVTISTVVVLRQRILVKTEFLILGEKIGKSYSGMVK